MKYLDGNLNVNLKFNYRRRTPALSHRPERAGASSEVASGRLDIRWLLISSFLDILLLVVGFRYGYSSGSLEGSDAAARYMQCARFETLKRLSYSLDPLAVTLSELPRTALPDDLRRLCSKIGVENVDHGESYVACCERLMTKQVHPSRH